MSPSGIAHVSGEKHKRCLLPLVGSEARREEQRPSICPHRKDIIPFIRSPHML